MSGRASRGDRGLGRRMPAGSTRGGDDRAGLSRAHPDVPGLPSHGPRGLRRGGPFEGPRSRPSPPLSLSASGPPRWPPHPPLRLFTPSPLSLSASPPLAPVGTRMSGPRLRRSGTRRAAILLSDAPVRDPRSLPPLPLSASGAVRLGGRTPSALAHCAGAVLLSRTAPLRHRAAAALAPRCGLPVRPLRHPTVPLPPWRASPAARRFAS